MSSIEKSSTDIPIDIYQSNEEMVIILPLGGVDKKSIEVELEKNVLIIKGQRVCPNLKENLMPIQQECFRGEFISKITLPQNVYFDKIHTKFTAENILVVVVPKVIIPDKIKLEVEYIS